MSLDLDSRNPIASWTNVKGDVGGLYFNSNRCIVLCLEHIIRKPPSFDITSHNLNKNNLQFVGPKYLKRRRPGLFCFRGCFRSSFWARHFNNKLFNKEEGMSINSRRRYGGKVIKLMRLKD